MAMQVEFIAGDGIELEANPSAKSIRFSAAGGGNWGGIIGPYRMGPLNAGHVSDFYMWFWKHSGNVVNLQVSGHMAGNAPYGYGIEKALVSNVGRIPEGFYPSFDQYFLNINAPSHMISGFMSGFGGLALGGHINGEPMIEHVVAAYITLESGWVVLHSSSLSMGFIGGSV